MRSPRAAGLLADDRSVERILICTPDKDMAQLVEDERVVLWDRRRNLFYDDAGVRAKWGVAPASIPDWLALVGDSSDGYPGLPGWGAKSAAAVLAVYGSIDGIPPQASKWEVPSLRGAPVLAATLRDQWDDAILYRSLARLRTAEDGVSIPQAGRGGPRVAGAPRAAVGGVLRRPGAGSTPRPPAPLARGVAARPPPLPVAPRSDVPLGSLYGPAAGIRTVSRCRSGTRRGRPPLPGSRSSARHGRR